MKPSLLLLAFTVLPVFAAEPAKPSGTVIEFRVDMQRPVANDLGRASVYVELTGSDPAEVARKVKAVIADGLAAAKSLPGVIVKSGATHTYPLYGKTGRIESWRMRSELLLESRDAVVLSSALGKLQGGQLLIGAINFSPAPETRRKVEDDLAIEAIEAFDSKAARIAAALKKPYKIRMLHVTVGDHSPRPLPLSRGMTLMSASEAAPMPVEAGESNMTVNVSGQIELLD